MLQPKCHGLLPLQAALIALRPTQVALMVLPSFFTSNSCPRVSSCEVGRASFAGGHRGPWGGLCEEVCYRGRLRCEPCSNSERESALGVTETIILLART